MSALEATHKLPQDLVAIFHASFHPTQGNVLDWALKASDECDLSQLEFNCLPSGLHLVERDVVYFSKGAHRGVCVFRRRRTPEDGHRGFRLSSLGVLLAPSARQRPWRHVRALQALVGEIYDALEHRGVLQPTDTDWDPARVWFDARKVRRPDLAGAGDWLSWPAELDERDPDSLLTHPTMHLPHLIRILGPSVYTLYKHVLGRRRVLIFTLPPVEAACNLCQVAADLCFDAQLAQPPPAALSPLIDGFDDDDGASTWTGAAAAPPPLEGRCKEGLKVLGMITLNDMDRLDRETETGTGWIACTTDAIFLEKPSHYDLLIDLTTSTPSKNSRPTLHVSTPITKKLSSRGPTHTLTTVRSSWSDVKLWTELDRILLLDASSHAHAHAPGGCCSPTASSSSVGRGPGGIGAPSWDVWQLYEDVCVLCAGLWFGGWRRNSLLSYSTLGGAWGAPRADGDDDLSLVRTLGQGIEGRPAPSASVPTSPVTPTAPRISKVGIEGGRRAPPVLAVSPSGGISNTTRASARRASGMSSWSAVTKVSKEPSTGSGSSAAIALLKLADADEDADSPASSLPDERDDVDARRRVQAATARALLQTFDAHTRATLGALARVLARAPPRVLTPGDAAALALGPLSALDARFVGWLADEYGPPGDAGVAVRRGWRELLGLLLGLGA